MRNQSWAILAATSIGLTAASAAQARITRLEISKVEPAFSGKTFGAVGAYERVSGTAFGEVDPKLPGNAIIQDIKLAPRNARGMVEYSTPVDILRPAARASGNGVLFFNIVNCGNKGAMGLFNADVTGGLDVTNNLAASGDGFMQARGFTMVWFGWQADVAPGGARMGMSVPVAKNPDGSSTTGNVRSELVTASPQTTLNLSGGWFTAGNTRVYPTVSTDNSKPLSDGFLPTLTIRSHEAEPRAPIPNSEWSFGACPQGGALTPNETQICYPKGFTPGHLYELTYRAKDPLVLGLGFAAARDLAAFLKGAQKDDAGGANPVFTPGAKAIVMGSSQSGRFVRSLIHLGFNRDERGKIAFDGAMPHIGGGLMPLNVRFGQPGRAAGTEQVDRAFPGTDFPFAYAKTHDPLSGRTQGILDRCAATNTCPKIIHAATALEMWELRQSLGFTDPLGTRDLAEPANVRSYILASTQHSPPALPLPAQPPFGVCQQQANPNPHVWTMRALLTHMTAWIKEGKAPPPSERPTIAAGNLVGADQVHFPGIPATNYGGVARPPMKLTAINNPLHILDQGKGFIPGDASGALDGGIPRASAARYGNLVAQVDIDGNDLGGIADVYVQAPIGTYTGWNLFNKNSFEGGFCTLNGSFVPFAPTKAERVAAGDPRLSLEERYPTKDAYVSKLRAAADNLVARGFLLPEDAARLTGEAERNGMRMAP